VGRREGGKKGNKDVLIATSKHANKLHMPRAKLIIV
jgi:hypothetical protein